MPQKKSPHQRHHGNLRQALIEAGLKLLESGGPEGLTLRKCAAAAGVSHAAPANHFNGLISLKIAIIARGHLLFAEQMRQASLAADPQPHAQLNAICEAYIDFAREHRTLFQFMFQYLGVTLEDVDETSKAEKMAAAEASYGALREACAPFEHINDDALNTETMIWSLVHGYALLFSDTECPTSPDQKLMEFSNLLPTLALRQEQA